jgi:hypothetical protein
MKKDTPKNIKELKKQMEKTNLVTTFFLEGRMENFCILMLKVMKIMIAVS